jgi:hypothetical protein
MPALEITFSGLCLFVPNAAEGVVHVLMPRVENAHGGSRFVARLLAESFAGPAARPMEGWSLVLGNAPGTADTSLTPEVPSRGELLDLSRMTGQKLPRRVLASREMPELTARVTLRAGRVHSVEGGSTWEIQGRPVVLAQSLTWRMEGIPDALAWASAGAVGAPPLESLAELAPADDGLVRLHIHHGPESGLEDVGPGDVQEAFQACYRLLDITHPRPLPRPTGDGGSTAGLMLAMVLSGDDDMDDWSDDDDAGGLPDDDMDDWSDDDDAGGLPGDDDMDDWSDDDDASRLSGDDDTPDW